MNPEKSEYFVRLLTGCQCRLYAYILSLVTDVHVADDVLQNTNVALWRKADEFEPGTEFAHWAIRVAHFEVLAHRKRQYRDRHVYDDALLDKLAPIAIRYAENVDESRIALRNCLARLSTADRTLVCQRYEPRGSVQKLAQRLGKSAGAISQALYRIRRRLALCIEQTLTAGSRAQSDHGTRR